MGKFLISVIVLTAVFYVAHAAAPSCPLSSQMTICSPKCKDDTECFGRKCCPNICNTKSCVEANQQGSQSKYSSSSSSNTGGSSGGTGSYCGNVKCNSYQKCQNGRCV
ncbi:hypothetical protein RN001_004440 [Aquatica leii]|uniref:WAP domain-containing protein n=1 Tax=Aquatica leii TaxID=1421715 RepID=A0AAN7PID3_9COLE|nr:hypothetical protein RN001_004440 [Aquatica leii]